MKEISIKELVLSQTMTFLQTIKSLTFFILFILTLPHCSESKKNYNNYTFVTG